MSFLNYIRILRPVNLVIVAIAQFLIFWVYLLPLTSEGDLFVLKGQLWWLFIIDTLLIAAGGYIINDLMDQQADQINKPKKQFIGSDKIASNVGWLYYIVIVLAGLGLAYYIAREIDKMHLIVIYPIATGLLYAYSVYFKKMPLIGNLIVSLFCAFVPAIIWFAEFNFSMTCANCSESGYTLIIHLFAAYITFAFLSTFVREIIKDIEDMEGDDNAGYQTMPIVIGVDRSKVVALFIAFLLLCSYGLWFYGYEGSSRLLIWMMIIMGMFLPTVYILNLIRIARSTADYSRISKYLKYLMIVSLFIFLCIPIIVYS